MPAPPTAPAGSRAASPTARTCASRLHEADLDADEAAALGGPDDDEDAPAAIERSDVCAVPAAAVVGEAMVALVLADAVLERFGGDTSATPSRGTSKAHVARATPCALRRVRATPRDPAVMMRDPILRWATPPCSARRAVEASRRIDALIDDMIETMYAAPGIGLAAPQVGVPLRIFVVDLSVGRDPSELLTIVNPEFVEREGMQLEEEGCLSVPGFNATVPRPARAVVRGLDRARRRAHRRGHGPAGARVQHEMDHLDGRLFVDRLRGIKRDLIVRRVRSSPRGQVVA
jgi:peptide deformylase